MKNILILYTLSFLLLTITSCEKSDNTIERDYLEVSLKNFKLDPSIKWVVILPGLGCTGCIQEAEAFMQDHVENNRILFVLTKVESLKILQKKLEIDIIDYPNVFVDRNYEFHIPSDNSIYPCIIRFENSKLVSHEFQSPDNSSAFENLKKDLIMEQ